VIASTGKRFGCNIISAVNNLGKLRFRVFQGSLTQKVFIDFLARLIRDAKRKVIVIADGHPVHKGRRVKQWLEEHKSECELVILPGYAPELNPDELLNQDLKSNVFSAGRAAHPRRIGDSDSLVSQKYPESTRHRPRLLRGSACELRREPIVTRSVQMISAGVVTPIEMNVSQARSSARHSTCGCELITCSRRVKPCLT
jgi:transposase